jgi:uncharacterized membrane protein
VSTTDRHIQRWRDAGVIDEATAERIAAFEAGRPESTSARGLVIEAVSYLGAALVAAGVIVLAIARWNELGDSAQVLLPAVPGFAALVAGFLLRGQPTASLRRAAQASWLLGGALTALAVGVMGDNAGLSGENAALLAGILAVTLAIALWSLQQGEAQLAGIAAAFMVLAIALSVRVEDSDHTFAVQGSVLAVLGLLGMAAAEYGLLRPLRFSRALFGFELGLGAFLTGVVREVPAGWEAPVFVAAALLVVAGVRMRSLTYLVLGAVALFSGLVRSILRYVDDPTLAAVLLIAAGLALVAVVVGIALGNPAGRGRGRRGVARDTPAG